MTNPDRPQLLVIDDDLLFCDSIALYFQEDPFEVSCCNTGKDGLFWCRKNRVDVILLDHNLPDTDGISLCKEILQEYDRIKIIFITAQPSFKHAVQALRMGASDYLAKPFELEELNLAVNRAFRSKELEQIEQFHKFTNRKESSRNVLIGLHDRHAAIRDLIDLAATTSASVLLTGETGTGKSVIAKMIHYGKDDSTRPFVSANSASLPETLIEAEFFGYEKGAFTGAARKKRGLFEMADGGTLFLDEIGEIPMHLQPTLLGVLDDGCFRRLGGETTIQSRFRLIAATNVNLEKAITANHFRRDLYYRLSVIHIHLPPLRERLEDLEELCSHFIQAIDRDQKIVLPKDELTALAGYHWPGNIRELKNILERAILLRRNDTIHPGELLKAGAVSSNTTYAISGTVTADNNAGTLLPLADMEKQHIETALKNLGDNHTHAARALGIARSTLVRKIQKYKIKSSDSNQDTVSN